MTLAKWFVAAVRVVDSTTAVYEVDGRVQNLGVGILD